MDEMASDNEIVSVKPVLMVAGMLVAAMCGAVMTVHPGKQQPQPSPKAPPAVVLVMQGPQAQAHLQHRLMPPSHQPSQSPKPAQDADWV